MRRFTFFLLCVVIMFGFGEPLRHKIARGNAHFEKGEYEDAMTAYTDAQLNDPHNPALYFNMAGVLYRQRKYDEAMSMYEKAREKADPRLESEALYNGGCTLYRQGKLKESLDMFKQALEKNPEDQDTKYNVEFVEQKIKEMLNDAQKRMEQQQSAAEGQQKDEQSAGQSQLGKEEKNEEQQGAAPSEEQTASTEGQKAPQDGKDAAAKDKEEGTSSDKKQDEQQKEKGTASTDLNRVPDKEMSKEEAERYLDMLAVDDTMQPVTEGQRSHYSNYRLEKDW